jgi:hypothetical protein
MKAAKFDGTGRLQGNHLRMEDALRPDVTAGHALLRVAYAARICTSLKAVCRH